MILKDIYYVALQLFFCVLLYLLAGFSEKYISSKWKLMYLLPAVLCIVMISVSGVEKLLIPLYIGSALMAAGFIWEKKLLRRIVSAATAVLTLLGTGMCIVYPTYRTVDFVDDFENGFADMKTRYVLAEHKAIDWDALHEKYLPMFEEANELSDEKKCCLAWLKLCAEFRDGHVGFSADDEGMYEEVTLGTLGNDYGLAILNYADGRAVAVDVDSSLNKLGIHNGTIITAWNGKEPSVAASESKANAIKCYPDEENAYFFRSFFAAGTGNGNVTFIDDNGDEQTVQLTSLGNYYDRIHEASELLCGGIKDSNMSFSVVSDKVACLRIKMMMYDTKSLRDDDYADLKRTIKRRLRDLKEEGITDIVIDLRDNSGGDGTLVMGLSELFAPVGEHFYCYDGQWDRETMKFKKDGDKFLLGKKNVFEGENIMGNGHIVILVNHNSVSAADHLVKVLGSQENVTVMGFTKPNCSAQGVTAIKTRIGSISVSGSIVLNQDGTPLVDAGADHISAQKLDVQIPFDEDALTAIYDNGEDYLMKKAIEYLSK